MKHIYIYVYIYIYIYIYMYTYTHIHIGWHYLLLVPGGVGQLRGGEDPVERDTVGSNFSIENGSSNFNKINNSNNSN